MAGSTTGKKRGQSGAGLAQDKGKFPLRLQVSLNTKSLVIALSKKPAIRAINGKTLV